MKRYTPYIRIIFEPRDIWIGLYIKKPYWEMGSYIHVVYLCLIPMFPILISWSSKETS